MIDFHTHTLLSDGELIPAEHIRRAEVKGYRILGFADHGDLATMANLLPTLREAAGRENELGRMTVVVGVELTHLRPVQFAEAVRRARDLGAQVVLAHGETLVEPVEPGTNCSAIEAGVDILAHPGLISPDDVKRAVERDVCLEISGRHGHSFSNGHVARLGRDMGAKLIFGSDAHASGDMPTRDFAERLCRAAGLDESDVAAMFRHAEALAQRAMQRRRS
ncbi:MAG: histidinol phosphate phosphatase domain-containing protein [Phycisphaerae bacterium]|nr:histidinol phosphate phosphatase domain-containing protein [Phycisphaerae bacterium]